MWRWFAVTVTHTRSCLCQELLQWMCTVLTIVMEPSVSLKLHRSLCSMFHCKIYFLIVIYFTLLCDSLCDLYYCYTRVSMSDVHVGTSPSSPMNGYAESKCRAWRTSPVLLLHCLPTQAHNCSQYGIEANVKMIFHHVPTVFFHTVLPRIKISPHSVYSLLDE